MKPNQDFDKETTQGPWKENGNYKESRRLIFLIVFQVFLSQ